MHICFLGDANHVNCRNWAEYLAATYKHQVSIISFEAVTEKLNGVHIEEINWPYRFNKLKYLCCAFSVKKMIRKLKPDVLIGYRVSSYGFLGAFSGFHPFVLVAQGQHIDNPEHSFLKKQFIQYAIKRADHCHAFGEHMRDGYMAHGANRNKISVFPKGVRTDRFRLRDQPKGEMSMIMTRGLKKGYDLDLPFKALAHLKRKGVILKFSIAGDGPLKKHLSKVGKSLKIDEQLTFLGHLKNEQLPLIYAVSHIYISPVPTDGVSASLLEAMATGLIPVVVDNPANRLWITHQKNGFLFQKGDIKMLTGLLLQIIQKRVDVESIRKFNRHLVEEKGNWAVNMDKFNTLLNHLR